MVEDLPPMEYRFWGRTGLKVSVVALGSWLTYGGHVGDERAFEYIKAAYDEGINFFDTAEEYNGREAENLSNLVNNVGLLCKHIIEAMELSLKWLGLAHVDIIYAHRPDRQTPMEEIVRGFNHLINTGKAFYWGTSEWSASEITDAWRIADKFGLIGPDVEKPQYNLLERQRVEREYRRLYNTAHGLGLTVFLPLKMGILTGKYNDVAALPPDSRLGFAATFGDKRWQHSFTIVAGLKPIAEELGCSLAQLALAWVLKNPHVSSLIMGASQPEQIYENVRSLDVVNG
ncbi:hypothetical protein VTN77DRAFT_5384 [Rasamsonia byssochlamydoides]|uniref:uncharacterized protein n=1 Tax=Rasamsonia byssochlamydoides TaxID=89139 RepID=UPI0037448355